MEIRSVLNGLPSLQDGSLGDPLVCVAVLDGPVDLSHPCFRGADLTRLNTLVQSVADGGPMSVHGTHVTSVIFGQPDSPVFGIAPRCRGLILPVFGNDEGHLSQLDLARAIEQAVQGGAHVINVSGGEQVPRGEADPALARALKLCEESNVLVIAATGNDACECLHVPAAFPSVLAVGALGADGAPLEISNWGEAYRSNGVLAPGKDIRGAVPGGGVTSRTGSSFATPIVSGVAALLLSVQRQGRGTLDPRAVGRAILATATPCHPRDSPECRRHLVGTLNVPGAYAYIEGGGGEKIVSSSDAAQVRPAAAETIAVAQVEATAPEAAAVGVNDGVVACSVESTTVQAPETATPATHVSASGGVLHPSAAVNSSPVNGVAPSGSCGCNGNGNGKKSYVFSIGTVGFDFGTEARRDSFRQLMPRVSVGGTPPATVPPNPYDVVQLCDYLDAQPSESTKLIWTLNLDLTPIYAVEAELGYADEVYKVLRSALRNESLPTSDANFVSRVSIPGTLMNRTRRLFSGQIVPVVVAQPRGLYSWNETALVDSIVQAVGQTVTTAADTVRQSIRHFLDKVYYQLRNLGHSSPDRALNFAATNAFIFAEGVREGLLSARLVPGGTNLYTLDTIQVSKSAYCRMDSDCWDVQVTFFDPENDRRARCVYQYTIDVSDEMPVSLAPTHQFLVAR